MESRRSIVASSLSLLLLATGLLALGDAARAQCHTWSSDLGVSGLFGDSGARVVVFDDGGGTAPYAVFKPSSGPAYSQLVRFDGRDWLPFADPSAAVLDVAVFDDGSGPALFVAGAFTSFAGVPANSVAKYDGQTWSAVGAGVDGVVRALAVQTVGAATRLYLGGQFLTAGGAPVRNVASWDGVSWSSLGGGVNSEAYAFAAFDSGSGPELIVGGAFDEAGGTTARRLARWNGVAWSELGGGVSFSISTLPIVWSLRTYDDGSGTALYVGGQFDRAGALPVAGLARWDGTSFSDVGGGVHANVAYTGSVRSLQVHDEGSGSALYVGGSFATAGSTSAPGIARWDGAWHALGSGVEGPVAGAAGTAYATAPWNDGHGDGLLVVGAFEFAGGRARKNAALWRANAWHTVGVDDGLVGSIESLASFDGGNGRVLYCGGNLSYAGGVPSGDLVRWDGATFAPVGGGVGDGFANTHVAALVEWNDGSGPALYVGGLFAAPPGASVANLAKWDGTNWSSLGGANLDGVVSSFAVFDDGTGPALYVAGAFTHVGTLAANNIAKWDGVSWHALDLGLQSLGGAGMPVRCMNVYDDGTGAQLYAGGAFLNAGAGLIPYLARWNGTAWSSVGAGVFGPYYATHVASLSVVDAGSGPVLIAAGTFQDAGPSGSPGIAQWNGTWSAPAWTTPGSVFDARITHDAGDGRGRRVFGLLTSGTSASVAAWDGAQLEALPDGQLTSQPYSTTGTAAAFAAFDDAGDGRALFVGGAFRQVGGKNSPALARWSPCGEIGRTTCFGDGSTTACPCGNTSAVGARAGCVNSSGAGAALRASGDASLSHDTILLAGSGMPDGPVLYFQGLQLLATPVVFGDGLRCTGGPFVRLGVRINTGGASAFPPAAAPGIATSGLLSAPGTRHYQARFRDAASFCTPDTFGYSNAVSLIWAP